VCYIELQSFRSVRIFYESDSSSDNWLACFIFLPRQGTARGKIPSVFWDRNLRVDAHFRWRQFLRHIPLLSLSLYFPSFSSFSIPLSRWFMLLVWLWRTLGFALRNGIVPGLRNVFDGGYGSRRWKKLPNVASNGENAFFPPVTCRTKRTGHYEALVLDSDTWNDLWG